MTNHGCFKLPLKNNNSNNKIPGRTGPKTKAHVALRRQRIIAQLLEVLWPQVLVSVPRQRIFACGWTKQATIRSFPLKTCLLWRNLFLWSSASRPFSLSSSPVPWVVFVAAV